MNVCENLAATWNVLNSELLALHNAYRREVKFGKVPDQPQALHMTKLEWSYQLAESAQLWANHCVPIRSNISMRNSSKWTYVGQSVAVVSQVKDAVSLWFDEHKNYNITKNTCMENKLCADYKQLAYTDTTHIGCGYARCKNLNASKNILVVCNYGPGGKYAVRRPYYAIYPGELRNSDLS
ncbi:unnamed protein product [Schistosoma turkestanicum]|nr:unnamed protein product [Schistosoma turkestanicum]